MQFRTLQNLFNRSAWFGVRLRFLLVCQLLVLPLIIYRLAELNIEADAAYSRSWQSLDNAAITGSERFTDVIDDVRTTLEILSRIPDIARGTGACPDILASVLPGRPWAAGFHVADASGDVLCSTNADAVGLNIGDRAYFIEALRLRRFVAGDFLIGRKSRTPIIGTAFPVGRDGQLYVIVATVNLRWLQDLASSIFRQQGSEAAVLVDSTGEVLAQYPDDGRIDPAKAMLAPPEAGTRNHHVAVDRIGTAQMMVSTIIPGTRTRLFLSRPQAEAFAGINASIKQVVLGWAALLLATTLLVWLYADAAFLVPLRAISMVAARIGGGDLDARVGSSSWAREFGQLGSTIDQMGRNLQIRVGELSEVRLLLQEAAMRDSLTGLANRRCLDAEGHAMLQIAAKQPTDVACILIDVDHFKKFNDRYGHAGGDDALQRIGGVLAEAARVAGGLAARFGGEEFAILLQANETAANEVALRVMANIHGLAIQHLDSERFQLTVSIGVSALVPTAQTTLRDLMKTADKAMYAAKLLNRDQIFRASDLLDAA